MEQEILTMTALELKEMLTQIANDAAAKALESVPNRLTHQPSPAWHGKFRETREKYISHPNGLLREVYGNGACRLWDNVRALSARYAGAKNVNNLSLQQADIAGEFAEKVCELLLDRPK